MSKISKTWNLLSRQEIIKSTKTLNKIMVTGGYGQIGSSLIPSLNHIYGEENVLITDIENKNQTNNFKKLDCLDFESFQNVFNEFKPDMLVHLPALLSAKGEENPEITMKINNDTFIYAINLCWSNNTKLFAPSSMSVYGEHIKNQTKNNSPQFPKSIYGVTKVYLELLGSYYKSKKGLDFRSLRYPGVLSSKQPGKGTTDYATEIFYKYVKNENYVCYLREDSELPFIDEQDLIIETIKFLETNSNKLKTETYSIQSCSLTPFKLFNYLKEINPDFEISYDIDFRQGIADSWPNKMSISDAKKDWDFNPLWKEKDSILRIINELK